MEVSCDCGTYALELMMFFGGGGDNFELVLLSSFYVTFKKSLCVATIVQVKQVVNHVRHLCESSFPRPYSELCSIDGDVFWCVKHSKPNRC